MRCPYCGGRVVIEYLGSYGNVYPLKKNGEPGTKRIRRFLYEESRDAPLIYCWDCRKMVEGKEGKE